MNALRKLILLFLLLPAVSFAALRGTTSTAGSTSATSAVITYAGASNIQLGDLIVLLTSYEPGGSATITDPSGFTKGSLLSPSLPDVLVGSSSYIHVAVKIAAAGDVGTPSYTTTFQFTGWWCQQLRVYSGRVNSSIAAAFNNQVPTAAGSSVSTPIAYNLTGLTALAGDDIIAVSVVDNDAYAAATWSSTITGFSNALVAHFANAGSSPLLSLDYVNNGGGSTGTLVHTISATATNTGAPVGFVMSLPAAGGGGAAAPTNGGFVISDLLLLIPAANDPRMPMDRLVLPYLKAA